MNAVETDLFGAPIPLEGVAGPGHHTRPDRRKTVARGYAATPGGGPKGETCKTCAHYCRVGGNKIFLKCGLLKGRWTKGPGTDIRASAPACQLWKPKPESPS